MCCAGGTGKAWPSGNRWPLPPEPSRLWISGAGSPQALMVRCGFSPEEFVAGETSRHSYICVCSRELGSSPRRPRVLNHLWAASGAQGLVRRFSPSTSFFSVDARVAFFLRSSMAGPPRRSQESSGQVLPGCQDERSSPGLLAFATLPLIASFVPSPVSMPVFFFVVILLFFFASTVGIPDLAVRPPAPPD